MREREGEEEEGEEDDADEAVAATAWALKYWRKGLVSMGSLCTIIVLPPHRPATEEDEDASCRCDRSVESALPLSSEKGLWLWACVLFALL